MKAICQVCWRHCALEEGETGFCQARSNVHGRIICKNYGSITALAMDPIEKKPLYHFMPGTTILSVGSYGCNYTCAYCQNASISQVRGEQSDSRMMTPEQLVQLAAAYKAQGNIGLAYTYNEPLIGYEFVRDCAMLVKAAGMKNVAVTNGSVSIAVLEELLPYLDAFNVDLKAFHQDFYRKIGGVRNDVQHFIERAVEASHVEVTMLVIPGENDSPAEIEQLSRYLAQLDPKIPLHVSRFFPRYQMQEREAAPVAQVYQLADIARRHLHYVYTGNC